MVRSCLAPALVCVALAGCNGLPTPTSASQPTTASLQAAPTSVQLAGTTLTLTSSPYRDFMPTVGTSDTSMRMILTVKVAGGGSLPSGVTVDGAWALNGSTVWSTWTLIPGQTSGSDYVVSATKGPTWDEGTMVMTVIRLKNGVGQSVLLRAPNAAITFTF